MTTTPPQNSIVIPLQTSQDARAFKVSSIIQQEALERLQVLTNETLGRIDAFKDELRQGRTSVGSSISRFHDVISVVGGRGTGKTTFLLSALEHVLSNGNGDKLLSLGVIDPTLVETREHIFLNIITRVRNAVEEEHDRRISVENDNYNYALFQQNLRALARALSQISGIGSKSLSHDVWDDPIFVMEEGLQNISDGERLETNFHRFIYSALHYTNKKAFAIAFDDIDTDFSSGWFVLETIRKYLSTPQLIVLLSGDFDLYTNLVRMKQWKHFEKDFLNNEKECNQPTLKFSQRVDYLEDQYLLKVLKAERRIELRTISSILASNQTILIQPDETSAEMTIEEYLESALAGIFNLKEHYGLKEASRFLLSLPVRTIMQVCKAVSHSSPSTDQPDEDLIAQFNGKMASIFGTSLIHVHFKWPADLALTGTRFGMNLLVTALLKNEILDTGADLVPRFGRDELNAMTLVLSGFYSHGIHGNPSLLVDYFIKVLMVRDTLASMDKESDRRGYLKKVGIEIDELSLQTAQKHTAHISGLLSGTNEPVFSKGHLRVRARSAETTNSKILIQRLWNTNLVNASLHDENKYKNVEEWTDNYNAVSVHVRPFVEQTMQHRPPSKSGFKGSCYTTVGYLTGALRTWHKSILASLFTCISRDGYDERFFFSPYQMIALVGFLANTDQKDFESFLLSNTSIRTLLHGAGANSQKGRDLGFTDNEMQNEEQHLLDGCEEFFKAVTDWNRKTFARCPPQLFHNIWNRFIESAARIETETGPADLYVGWIAHRLIVSLFQAVLIEEQIYFNRNQLKLNTNSPTNKDTIFLKNLNTIQKHEADTTTSVFSWFFSCPLWTLLLNPDSEVMSFHKQWRDDRASDESEAKEAENPNDPTTPAYAETPYFKMRFPNLYDLLNSIVISKELDSDAPVIETASSPAEQDEESPETDNVPAPTTPKLFPAGIKDHLNTFIRKDDPGSKAFQRLIAKYRTTMEHKWKEIVKTLKGHGVRQGTEMSMIHDLAGTELYAAHFKHYKAKVGTSTSGQRCYYYTFFTLLEERQQDLL